MRNPCKIHAKPPWGPQDPQDPFKTFRQAFEGVLKEFAMQFEAHLLEIPYEMEKKTGETVLGSPRGVSHGFHMDFTWISHGFHMDSHGFSRFHMEFKGNPLPMAL